MFGCENIPTWRMFPDTLAGVSLHDAAELHVLQTELTEEELGQLGVFLEEIFLLKFTY